jgi:hypothetical protein
MSVLFKCLVDYATKHKEEIQQRDILHAFDWTAARQHVEAGLLALMCMCLLSSVM